jgi:hypothetical protein
LSLFPLTEQATVLFFLSRGVIWTNLTLVFQRVMRERGSLVAKLDLFCV